MTDLSPETQGLLELARDGDDPSNADRLRVRRALGASLAAGAALSATTHVASASAKGAAAGAALSSVASTAKIAAWVAVGALAGVGATTTVLWVGGDHTSRPASVAAPVRAPSPVAPVAPAAAETPESEEQAGMVPEPAAPATRTLEPATNARPTPKPSASSLTEETALLSEARAALGRGDAERALALLSEHEHRYASGALREERLAAEVFALCALGRRADAARTAATLLRESPGSPQRARVLDSCAYRP